MAATDEFPRGTLQQNSSAVNTIASITLPAIPGVAWVLTEIEAAAVAFGGAVGIVPAIFVNGATIGHVPADLQNNQGGTFSWSGPLTLSIGQAVTVQFSGTAPNCYEDLAVAAYPI
jgi:hypothetical protein